jgi:hypothetical protein
MQADVAKVRSAPLKRASQQEAIGAYLARLAASAKPRVGFDTRGAARVLWSEDLIASKDDLLGVLAFIFGPQQIAAAFQRELQPEVPNALSPAERDKRLTELVADLLLLERREEQLIERAGAEGHDVLRRVDASPMAVLNLVIAKEAQATAA